MSETGKLAEALSKAQKEFPDVPKTRTATVKGKNKSTGEFYEYSYQYADFADVLKAVRPVLSENGLAFSQPILRKELKLHLTSKLMHVSGEILESDGLPLPEIMEPQQMGSLLSYWRRYDGCALLGIQPDEDDDARRASIGAAKGRFERQESKMEKQAVENRISAKDVRAFWAAVSAAGKKPMEVKTWLREKRYPSVEEIPQDLALNAIKWASSQGTNVPADMTGVLRQSADSAERLKVMKRLFATANEYRIPEGDVKTCAYERYKVDSMTKLTVPQLEDMVVWVKEVAAAVSES